MANDLTEKDRELIRGMRMTTSPICDADWVDYQELYDELFSRSEQSIGARLRIVEDKKEEDGGDK